MGNPISGREVTIALHRGATWTVPVLVGANDGLLVKTNNVVLTPELLPDQPLGTGFETSTDRGKDTVAGAIEGDARFDGNEWLAIAQAMGQAGAPASISAGVYQHTLQMTPGIAGLFWTMVQKMKTDLVFEWPSIMAGGFTLKGGKLIPTTFTIQMVGAGLNQNGASGTNNNTTIGNVTYRDKRNRMIGDSNAYLRANLQGGSALAPTDRIYVSEWELAFVRPIEGDHVLDGTNFLTEPSGTDFLTIELTIRFPKTTDQGAGLLAAIQQRPAAPYKLDLYMQGAEIVPSSGQFYRMQLQAPQAYLNGPTPAIGGPGKIPMELKFRLTQALAAPAGMTGVVNPFAISLVNARGTDYLA
jgi:hypothetical protein